MIANTSLLSCWNCSVSFLAECCFLKHNIHDSSVTMLFPWLCAQRSDNVIALEGLAGGETLGPMSASEFAHHGFLRNGRQLSTRKNGGILSSHIGSEEYFSIHY